MSILKRLFGGRRPESGPEEVYAGLRHQALSWKPESLGVQLPHDGVFGVLMDMGFGDGAATIVSMSDGTTSMYTTGGGGVIGAGEHERPAAASRALVQAAQAHRDLFSPDWSDGPLGDGEIRLLALTPSGVLAARGLGDELAEGDHPLSPVFFAANDVITELRRASGD